jgi:hypothetical protein
MKTNDSGAAARARSDERDEKVSGIGNAADALNEELHRAEELLRKQGFGVSAEVVVRSGLEQGPRPDENDPWFESLWFGKRDGVWQLYLQSGISNEPDSWVETDLFAASLEVRVLAAKAIPKLVSALADAQVQRRHDIVATTNELSAYLDLIGRAN